MKIIFYSKIIRFVKDVDAALIRPGAALRAVQITTGFFKNILSSFENPKTLFLIKTTEFAKAVDAALMRPDAALRAVQITTGFFENILSSFKNPKNIISDQNN